MRFKWERQGPQEIRNGVSALDRETVQKIRTAFTYQAARSTGYMKTTAPWTDRTSAARNGLHATANFPPGAFELVLSHAVSYGIWLEVCNSGRYAIILPALRNAINELQGLLDGLWEK
jgi:hypothetical protein